mmetsp:Transcript_122106/g.182353  ORF Transcript_122106/g.182353 Transcript_122106/m.182353 type:complete len:558 (+) Transcript_122106:577-2250(+)
MLLGGGVEGLDGAVGPVALRAQLHHHLRRALGEDLVLAVARLDPRAHPLPVRRERELLAAFLVLGELPPDLLVLLLLRAVVNPPAFRPQVVGHDQQPALRVVALVHRLLQPLQRRREVGLGHGVDDGGLDEDLVERRRQLRPLRVKHLGAEDLDDGHLGGGEGAGLVGADGGGPAHRLARAQVPHQVLVLEHLLDRERERDRDGQREALRHRHHEDRHARDEEREQLRPVHVVVPRLLAAEAGVEGPGHADAEDDDGEDGEGRARLRDLVRHVVQLRLEDGASVLGVGLVHLGLHGALVRGGPDGHDQHAALALLHKGAAEDGRRLAHLVAIELVLALLLEHRLARQHLLADGQVVAADHVAVAAHDVAAAKQHDVAHHQLVARHRLLLPVPQHIHHHVVLLRVQRAELRLLLVVVHRPHHDHHKHSGEDGGALEPAHRVLLHKHPDDERDDGSEAEEDERRVLERLEHELPQRGLILDRDHVGPVLRLASLNLGLRDTHVRVHLEFLEESFGLHRELQVVIQNRMLHIIHRGVIEGELHDIAQLLPGKHIVIIALE